MLIHPRSVHERCFTIWAPAGRFTKNPDVVRLASGRLLLVYNDCDHHTSRTDQAVTILRSDDEGKTWGAHAVVDRRTITDFATTNRLITPRLSVFADGRLAVLIDTDNQFHEDLRDNEGNLLYWSRDDGETWTPPQRTAIPGFEPDRVLELGTRLVTASHWTRRDSQAVADVMSISEDRGKTWQEYATIAHNGRNFFCEGALVRLRGEGHQEEALACVMRDNLNGGEPSWVAFSEDGGRNWSAPQTLPFSVHRPYAKQLPDGRVLVTGRCVLGPIGTVAWCGDLRREAGTYKAGGPRRNYQASIKHGELHIINAADRDARWTLRSPESYRSEVEMEAEVRVEGPPGRSVAMMGIGVVGVAVFIGSDGLSWQGDHYLPQPEGRVDMTERHTLRLHHRDGLATVYVDGEPRMWRTVKEATPLADWNRDPAPAGQTHFGQFGDAGSSVWRCVRYRIRNSTQPDWRWSWSADAGLLPDDYQRRRLLQIHANTHGNQPWSDHGYSSWVDLGDGRIFLADYTNRGDEPGKAHLIGVHLTQDEL